MTSEGHNEPLMLRETREAPHVVRRLLTENREAVARLAAAIRGRRPAYAVTIARGSSDHACTVLKYVLETLLSVVRFGGQGFGKTARTTPVRKCHHPGVLERVEACMSINSSSWGRILIMRSSRLESRCHLSRRSRRCFDTVRAGTRADNH